MLTLHRELHRQRTSLLTVLITVLRASEASPVAMRVIRLLIIQSSILAYKLFSSFQFD
ncbi:hypothetical protein [Caudoviricetes sp.]|nr:hypothetical protein [Caudoviricetes sp.]